MLLYFIIYVLIIKQKLQHFSQFPGVISGLNMASACLHALKKKSIFTYHRVILFNYDVQCKKPFISYNRNIFTEDDIDPSWFSGPLTPTNRKKILPISSLGGGRFSVFCKIEIGRFFFLMQKCFNKNKFRGFCQDNINLFSYIIEIHELGY